MVWFVQLVAIKLCLVLLTWWFSLGALYAVSLKRNPATRVGALRLARAGLVFSLTDPL